MGKEARINIRCTRDEREYIFLMAVMAGMTISEYVLTSIMEAITGGNGAAAPWAL